MALLTSAPYQNGGNELVLLLVPPQARRVLDVGCGAGDNARRLKSERPSIDIVGVTNNDNEAHLAAPFMSRVHVLDVENELPVDWGDPFDLIIFSHFLEHLRDPCAVIRRILPSLTENGLVLIVVPNTLNWRTRFEFFRGRFNYTQTGILDRTHLRFFTFQTAASELVEPIDELVLVGRTAKGSAPLGLLRRRLLTGWISAQIDSAAVNLAPNLFAGEVALLAQRRHC